jgi:hypothetical protein
MLAADPAPERSVLRTVAALLAVAALAGCGGAQVAVPAEFPVPLVNPLPVTIGLYLDDELTSYRHLEEIESGGDWSIDLGPAQTPLFVNLATGLFRGYDIVPALDPPYAGVDAVLKPRISELQFTTPKQTRSEYFEVWIRYKFELFNPDGSLIADWDMTAYGKAHEQNSGTSASLQRAALNACRDAIAFFTIEFDSTPHEKDWLASQQGTGA